MSVELVGPGKIPSLGLGTFSLHTGAARDLVEAALAEGYRHIDTAQSYNNESEVGAAIAASSVPRDQVFLTTKILPMDFAAADFRAAAEQSLADLATDYIDLLLLHWPSREVPLSETLPVLDALIAEGKIRHAGISNFTIAQTREARAILKAPLAANQIEYHPFLDQSRLAGFLAEEGIPFEAYAPLARGRVFDDPVIGEIAAARGTGPAAVTLAWILSKPQSVAIPKTATPERLRANLEAADLTLTQEEIARIDTLARPDGRIVAPGGLAPDWD